MKSIRKYLLVAVIAVMFVVAMSCGKAEETKEADKESIVTEQSDNKEENKEAETETETEEVKEEVEEEPAEEVKEDENQGTEGDSSEALELSRLNGTYYSTLIGQADYDLIEDPYIESVELEDGYLVIKGSLQGMRDDDADDDDDDADDADDDDDDDADDTDDDDDDDVVDEELHEADYYRFKITEDTEFYSAGGSLGAISITLDEFVELAQYYNGLGMILEIEDGVIEEARITS